MCSRGAGFLAMSVQGQSTRHLTTYLWNVLCITTSNGGVSCLPCPLPGFTRTLNKAAAKWPPRDRMTPQWPVSLLSARRLLASSSALCSLCLVSGCNSARHTLKCLSPAHQNHTRSSACLSAASGSRALTCCANALSFCCFMHAAITLVPDVTELMTDTVVSMERS